MLCPYTSRYKPGIAIIRLTIRFVSLQFTRILDTIAISSNHDYNDDYNDDYNSGKMQTGT